jgi:hypothetical protein
MPTTVYDTLEIKLSNGTVITVQPLKINKLKKFLTAIKPIQDGTANTDEAAMEVFVTAGMICMEQFAPEFSTDKDLFEDNFETPTLMKILEIAGGLKLNNDDPNFQGANLTGNL